jgi:hypothetical protein
MMKKAITIVILLLSVVFNVESELDEKTIFDAIVNQLVQNGYVQFDRKKILATELAKEFYKEKYPENKIYAVVNTAMTMESGLIYWLVYINDDSANEKPNVISSVYITYDNKIYSFYKLNKNMETTEKVLFIIDGTEEWRDVFY